MPQLFDVLFDDLRGSNRNVNRLMSAGIIFVLLCHFYVVEPYFRSKADERAGRTTLENVLKEQKALSNQLQEAKQVSSDVREALSRIQGDIEAYPRHLRDRLKEIHRAVSTEADQTRQAPPSTIQIGDFRMPSQIKSVEEGALWYIEAWFNALVADLEKTVVDPIVALKIEGDGRASSAHEKLASEAMDELRAYLDTVDPEFWRSYEGGKRPVARDIQRIVSDSFAPVEKEVNDLLARTEQDIRQHKMTSKRLRDRLSEIKEETRALEERLQSLESPVGRLPLDLRDLIVLFPLLITLLIVMVAAAIRRSKAFYEALKREYSNAAEKPDPNAFQYFADCWYLPPYSSGFHPLLILAWSVVCLAVFARANFLITKGTALFTGPGDDADPSKWIAAFGAFIIELLIIGGTFWFMQRALRPGDGISEKAGEVSGKPT
jgi:chaperonin cofactor prefoldin